MFAQSPYQAKCFIMPIETTKSFWQHKTVEVFSLHICNTFIEIPLCSINSLWLSGFKSALMQKCSTSSSRVIIILFWVRPILKWRLVKKTENARSQGPLVDEDPSNRLPMPYGKISYVCIYPQGRTCAILWSMAANTSVSASQALTTVSAPRARCCSRMARHAAVCIPSQLKVTLVYLVAKAAGYNTRKVLANIHTTVQRIWLRSESDSMKSC